MKRFIKPLYPLIIILVVIFFLRLPSFFEPYWYGDEGIYLVLGQAMQRGAVLYRDIWDNKPPLLYLIYAIIPTLLWAKVTATICVLGTVVFVQKISKNYLAALVAGILLSIPLLEGTIANAELYFTLPIVIAAFLFLKNKVNGLVIGFLFTIAFLLKVPAVFDFLGLFLAYFITEKKFKPFFGIGLTFVFLMIPVILYFYFNHALGDFITASFAQNASYVAVGTGPLAKLSNPLFVKAFLLLLSLLLSLFLFAKKRITKELFFLVCWFGFSVYGALLSNRPYNHYLLQIVPPAVILFFYLIRHSGLSRILLVPFFLIIIILVKMFTGAFALDSLKYYQNWFDYVSERETWTDYINNFDVRTANSYAIADYLAARTGASEPIFVWGDASFVYVLANRPAATKFIQAHHLTTIPPANYDLIINRLKKYQPKFVVISRPGNFAFPALEVFVKKNYRLVNMFQDLYVYQNTAPINPPKFDIHYSL